MEIRKEDGSTVNKLTQNAVIHAMDSYTVNIPTFVAGEDHTYTINIKATDREGNLWFDGTVDSGEFPFSRLTVRNRDAIQGGQDRIESVVAIGKCRISILCQGGCLPTCEFHLNTEDCELITKNCGCQCYCNGERC